MVDILNSSSRFSVRLSALGFRTSAAKAAIYFDTNGTNKVVPFHDSLVPADRGFAQSDVDLFGFEVFFDAPGAEFAAEAGLFVASPGGFDVSWLHVVHPDDSGAQSFYGAHGLEDVAGPDCGGQAV